ncbi:hypothetical protein N0V83_001960 [Neocucurbitaria cava]|uniref:F-box domain-containing protein n=1 Tax=Neocucurbitaria cava TaxID=798079 RepID=A0A9W8YGK6_9PLEO|nr:hypothetical protein N0V83_001960 [Neocucurbitaria cava]
MSRPATSIASLPTELLFNVAAHLTHLDRNQDLSNLARVSRQWRPIAQEQLLKHPRFSLTHIAEYMWELGLRPHLAPHIESLEIWSKSEGRVRRDARGTSIKEYVPTPAPLRMTLRQSEMMDKCAAFIKHFARTRRESRWWRDALLEDVVPALFGVLLCILPNLRALRLGKAWLKDFPIFSYLLARDSSTVQFVVPSAWKGDCFAGALTHLLPRLEVLDVPADMVAMYFHSRTTAIFDFRDFGNLKELGITFKALSGFGITRHVSLNPRNMFPKSLEVLKISEASENSTLFLGNLCQVKKEGHFPALRRVEVYHAYGIAWTRNAAQAITYPDPVDDVRLLFRDAKLELYLYFPPCILRTWEVGGTPWMLKTESKALKRAERVCFKHVTNFYDVEHRFPRLEAEWDVDGDAVMA